MSLPRVFTRFPARRLAAVPVVGVAVVALAACDRPTPSVSLQSGKTYVTTSATQYVRGGQVTKHSPPIPRITVVPGGIIAVDVAPSVASHGYYLSVGGQRITDTIKKDHYRLEVGNTNGQAQIVLFQAPKSGSTNASGSWVFNLTVAP
ncbi:MAG: hypothetical protein ACQSGP_26210 [Frankia sp.]